MKAYKVRAGESSKNCLYSLVETFEQAIEKIATYKETIKKIKFATIGITIIDCGKCHCGRLAEKDILEQDGECLLCEKIRADAAHDKYEEEEVEDEEWDA